MSIENIFVEIEEQKASLRWGINEDIFKSYLFTLTDKELLKVFWKYIEDPSIYKFIRWNLVNRISTSDGKRFSKFLKDALTLIPTENYKIAIKLRSVLGQSKEALPKKYLLKLFDILIFNKRKNDRKLACWIAKKYFNESISKKLFLA